MSSKYIKKYSIPQGFRSLLSEFTKEILRNQPKDIVDFAVEYFKCFQQGLILDYHQRSKNIQSNFKTAIPKIFELLNKKYNINYFYFYQKILSELFVILFLLIKVNCHLHYLILNFYQIFFFLLIFLALFLVLFISLLFDFLIIHTIKGCVVV